MDINNGTPTLSIHRNELITLTVARDAFDQLERRYLFWRLGVLLILICHMFFAMLGMFAIYAAFGQSLFLLAPAIFFMFLAVISSRSLSARHERATADKDLESFFSDLFDSQGDLAHHRALQRLKEQYRVTAKSLNRAQTAFIIVFNAAVFLIFVIAFLLGSM